MVNLTFKSGLFPDALKCGIVSPIFKSCNPTDKGNYRPITVLIIISKLFERCIYNRFLDFFTKFSLISLHQYGFQKGISTETAIISLTEHIYNVINSKEIAVNIFIDFRKAFDTVQHDILIKKLEKYGIRGPALALMKSYLLSRTQKVKISGYISSPKQITIGIPQGTCLGPLLFLIYVNELPKISDFTFPIIFADDTTLCMRGDNINDLVTRANFELEQFYDWATANRLTINTDKTFTMTVTNKRLPTTLPAVTINDITIPSQFSGKLLGFTIDNKLSFKLHITNICKKVAKSTGIIYKLQKYLPTSSLISLYYTFVYPHLLYCNLAWGNSAETNLNQLFILQKKVIRIINKTPYNSHTNHLFYNNQILKLADISKLNIGRYMYLNPSTDYNFNHDYNTRHRHNLVPRFQRTNYIDSTLLDLLGTDALEFNTI